jgi:myeloid leukemia factor 1
MFGGDIFSQMMANMQNTMASMHHMNERMQSDPNSAFYSESRVMSYSSNGNGRPQVYEASSSTRQVPGGVRETRKTVRDSAVGVEKMAVGRHIKDRGHVIERERNTNTGDLAENQDYINLDESEAEAFNEEFRQHTDQYRSRAGPERVNRLGQGALGDSRSARYDPRGDRRHTQLALDYRDRH